MDQHARTVLTGLLTRFSRPTAHDLAKTVRCYICTDPFVLHPGAPTPESPLKLPCGHVWGVDCISEWLAPAASPQLRNSCPLCRRPILSAAAVDRVLRGRPFAGFPRRGGWDDDAVLLLQLREYGPRGFRMPELREGTGLRVGEMGGDERSGRQREWECRAEGLWVALCDALMTKLEETASSGSAADWLARIAPVVTDVIGFVTLGCFLDGLATRNCKVRHNELVDLVSDEYGELHAHLREEEDGLDMEVVILTGPDPCARMVRYGERIEESRQRLIGSLTAAPIPRVRRV